MDVEGGQRLVRSTQASRRTVNGDACAKDLGDCTGKSCLGVQNEIAGGGSFLSNLGCD